MFRDRTSLMSKSLIFGLLTAGLAVILTSCRCSAGDQGTPRIAASGPGRAALIYANDFVWSAVPSDDLSAPGVHKVNVACAGGVRSSEPNYYVLISGKGTPEAVKVTGGSCTAEGRPGTLEFKTQYAHSAGYTVGSASSGLQEALVAARFSPTNPDGTSQSGHVIVPPGEFKAFATVSVRASNMTVDFSGSIVECWMADTCILVGDSANSGLFADISLVNPRGRVMVVGGHSPFIEVNAQKTRIFNVSTRTGAKSAYFSSFVQVDDDQAFLLDGLDTELGGNELGYGVRCDATACDPVVSAPGPFNKFSAVGWLKHLNISMQCRGNGIDWQSGNTLRVSDSVIQGYAQYGVRAGIRRGGYGGVELDNVYEEVGGCSAANPLGKVGQAGVIAQGGKVKVIGGEAPSGAIPQFANTGKTNYRYYIVAHNSRFGDSNPLYAGNAMSSGSGNITVIVPDIPGASTFDLLRVTLAPGSRELAPYGKGDYAVVAGVPRVSACTQGICTFTDNQAAPHSYKVAPPTYFPLLTFWPGRLVLGASQDSSDPFVAATAEVDTVGSETVSVLGTVAPAVSAVNCAPAVAWTPIWATCIGSTYPPSDFSLQAALVLAVKPNADAGKGLNWKGRLNFSSLGTAPGHIITLSDSNFQKTIAASNNRPTNDPQDAFIGYDQGDGSPLNVGISLGAPKSISHYIGNVGDGTNWKERLTETQKSFAVPVVIKSGSTLTVGSGSPLSQMKIYGTSKISATATVPAQSCLDISERVTGLVATDQIAGVKPPGTMGNLSLNLYVSAPDTAVLHFCNPGASTAKVPPGSYSFLAVH
jgi:hypothetical protein